MTTTYSRTRVDGPQLGLDEMRALLKQVPTYSDLEDGDIQYISVSARDLVPLQSVLSPGKLGRAELAIQQHERLRLPLFSPIRVPWEQELPTVMEPGSPRPPRPMRSPLWLPPIVENHGDRHIIIDGHHRLFAWYRDRAAPSHHAASHLMVKVLSVANVRDNLPALPFHSMAEWAGVVDVDDDHYSEGRAARYRRYDESRWRQLPLELVPKGAD